MIKLRGGDWKEITQIAQASMRIMHSERRRAMYETLGKVTL